MGERQARRLCPQAIVVRPRMEAYSAASTAMFEVFRDTTPLVEGLSIDEAFLDVGGLRRIAGTPSEIAARLRHDVRERVGIPVDRGRGADQVPGEGRERRREARRLARRTGRRRARVPSRAPGGTVVGRRAGDGTEAARALDRHGRGRRAARRTGTGGDPRARGRAASPRARAQPRPAPGGGRPSPPFDRDAASARTTGALARRARDRPARAGRPAVPAPPRRTPRVPHGDAATAVRRLRASDALPHPS